MAINVDLGRVRVHSIQYETRAELVALLMELETTVAQAVELNEHVIVLAIPSRLRALMGWPARGVPSPEIFSDTLVFQRPRR